MPLKVSWMQGGSPHTTSESISDSFSSRIISGSGVWGCASAMSQRQLCPRTATAKSCVKSLLSGLCPTWDEQTGKSCAAVASSSQQPSNRAVCKVDTYTSRHRVLANPITNPTVISIISILFCLFFFSSRCVQITWENLWVGFIGLFTSYPTGLLLRVF